MVAVDSLQIRPHAALCTYMYNPFHSIVHAAKQTGGRGQVGATILLFMRTVSRVHRPLRCESQSMTHSFITCLTAVVSVVSSIISQRSRVRRVAYLHAAAAVWPENKCHKDRLQAAGFGTLD